MKMNLAVTAVTLVAIAILLTLLTENGIYFAGAILFSVYTLAVYFLGFFNGQSSVEKGHKMSLEAQRVNDEWDMKKSDGTVRLVVEVLKAFKGLNGNNNDVPMLPPSFDNGNTFDAETKYLTGFDDQ